MMVHLSCLCYMSKMFDTGVDVYRKLGFYRQQERIKTFALFS